MLTKQPKEGNSRDSEDAQLTLLTPDVLTPGLTPTSPYTPGKFHLQIII